MKSFGDQLRKIAAEREIEVEQLARGIFIQGVEMVVENTPVDEGFARGSWSGSVNSYDTEYKPNEDRQGSETISAAIGSTDQFKLGDTMYLVSNAPYMEKLEYGGYSQGPDSTDKTNSSGYSIQAPQGMVRLTNRKLLAGINRS